MPDVVAAAAAVVLVALGIANLSAVDGPATAIRQTVVAAIGLLLLVRLRRIRATQLEVASLVIYACSVLGLGAVVVAGVSANGATRWIGWDRFSFQPSELAKLGLLLALSVALGGARRDGRRFATGLALIAVPALLTVSQPDLSTTTLMVVAGGAMLVFGRVPARMLLLVVASGLAAAPALIGLLRPYQMQRMGSFLVGAHQAPSGPGWAVQQARIAIGSSAIVGRSSGELTDLLARYLPERHTDLALASVVEQYGLLAGALAVLASLILTWRLVLGAREARTVTGALFTVGLAVLFGSEVAISVGGNLGLLPLAGVPFPLLSFGGTALLVHLTAIGLALGLRRDGTQRPLWRPPRLHRTRPRLARAVTSGLTAVLLVFTAYGADLWRMRGAELAEAAHEQMTRCIRLPAPRGQITDRHGTALATTGSAPEHAKVLAVPALLRDRPAVLERLAGVIGRRVAEIEALLGSASSATLWVTVMDDAGADVAGALAAAHLDGVILVPTRRREYPTGLALGPLLGYAGIATPSEVQRDPDLPPGEIVGRSGLEQHYDAVLRGRNGAQCVYVTPAGVPVAMGPRREPVPGADLRLSIDLGLQRLLTDDLARALRAQSNPRAIGAAVAMDPRNGQVLAMASAPAFDSAVFGRPQGAEALRTLATAPGHPMLEHASQAALPPGSTFKLVVGAADVVHRAIPPEAVVPTGAAYTLGGHTFHNWKPMGAMNLVQSLAWSNDVYFYQLANLLGAEHIIDTARALGVGSRTGIDLPAESSGYLGSPLSERARGGRWYGGSTVILGIGQGPLQVTPLQVARWTAAVSTGMLVTPRLALATGTDLSGHFALPVAPSARIPFADTLGPVREGMRAAVTGGTATALAGLPFPVAAKTGTAQDGGLQAGHYDNWITAVVPAREPELVVTAVVQGPGTGANSATSVALAGLRHYLDQRPRILATAPTVLVR